MNGKDPAPQKNHPSGKRMSRDSSIWMSFPSFDGTGFKVLNRFHNSKTHQNRKLFYDQYLALMLLYFFTPVLTSLRGIQQATTLEKVQKRPGLKKTSLGSLSEASYVFDPELLEPLIKELADQAISQEKDPQLKQIYQSIKAVDGTLLPALPKMLWALWQNEEHRAAKLHLEFDIRKQVLQGLPSPTATAMKGKSSKPSSLPIRSICSIVDTHNTNSWATSSMPKAPSWFA